MTTSEVSGYYHFDLGNPATLFAGFAEWPALAPLGDDTYTDMIIYMATKGVLWNPLYLSHWPKPKHT